MFRNTHTIEVRRIFATQFLNSVYRQGIRSLNEISEIHVGAAVLSAGSAEGFCQKLPHFLKHLNEKELINLELYKAIPTLTMGGSMMNRESESLTLEDFNARKEKKYTV